MSLKHKAGFFSPSRIYRIKERLHFGLVLMREHLVRIEAVRALGMVRVSRGLRARAGRAGLHIGDYFSFDQTGRYKGIKRELDRGRETAGICDARRFTDAASIRFGQTINELALLLDSGMLSVIVRLEGIGVAQSKITREIDHLQLARQPRHDFHRLSVRKRKEQAVEFLNRLWVGHRLELQIRKLREIRMHFVDSFARVLSRGDQLYLNRRMKQQYSKQLAAAIARSAEDSYLDHCSNFSLTIDDRRSP